MNKARDAGLEGRRRMKVRSTRRARWCRYPNWYSGSAAVVAPGPGARRRRRSSKFWGVTWNKNCAMGAEIQRRERQAPPPRLLRHPGGRGARRQRGDPGSSSRCPTSAPRTRSSTGSWCPALSERVGKTPNAAATKPPPPAAYSFAATHLTPALHHVPRRLPGLLFSSTKQKSGMMQRVPAVICMPPWRALPAKATTPPASALSTSSFQGSDEPGLRALSKRVPPPS